MNSDIDSYRVKIVKWSGLLIILTLMVVAAALYFIKIDGMSIIHFLVNYYLSKT